jgi:hypothetical protein
VHAIISNTRAVPFGGLGRCAKRRVPTTAATMQIACLMPRLRPLSIAWGLLANAQARRRSCPLMLTPSTSDGVLGKTAPPRAQHDATGNRLAPCRDGNASRGKPQTRLR